MSDPHETPAIDALLKEYESLWKASQLLEEIYSLVGDHIGGVNFCRGYCDKQGGKVRVGADDAALTSADGNA